MAFSSFVTDPANGLVWAYSGSIEEAITAPDMSKMVFVCHTSPEFITLIGAAKMLYETNKATQSVINSFIEICEAQGADAVVDALQSTAANLSLAQRCADEGINKVFGK